MTADIGLRNPPSESSTLRAARRVRSQSRFSFDGQDGDVVRIPPGNVTRLVQQLAATVTSNILQIIPLTAHSRTAGAFSDAVWRSLADDARTDVQVRRLYLVPPGGTAPEPEQTTVRFQVRSIAVRDFIGSDLIPLPVSDLWLIDDSIAVSDEPAEVPFWQVSARHSDIDRFRELWEELWERQGATAPPEPFAEPLVQSADMMATIAKMSCNSHMYVEGTCSWYHGVWQYLRLFDLVSSPAWHSAFYREALYKALQQLSPIEQTDRRGRVLITGSADYSMLAYVLNSSERAQVPVFVRVADQCRTPLIACEWYARLRGLVTDAPSDTRSQVVVCETDLLQADQSKTGLGSGYNLITTDAFLTRFERPDAETIVAAWHRLLNPGGVVVTTVHVHPLDAPRGGVLDEVSDFTIRARDRAARWRPYIRMRLDELTTAAQQYAMQMRSYDLGDVAAIRKLFAGAGFTIEDDQTAQVPGELRPATYLRIIARKSR